MSHPTTLEYLDGLRSSRLLDDDRLSELQRLPEADAGDTDGLARHAQQRGWLSPYQVNELREGRGGRLMVAAYRLVEKLTAAPGRVTYKATHPALPDPVSLSVIDAGWLPPADNIDDYVARTQAACLVNNAHLTNVLDAGRDGETIFVVQEYADGCDLSQLITEMGAMPLSLAAEYTRQAAVAVQAAHAAGVAHGAVSPFTLILTPVKRVVHEASGFVSVRPRLGSVVKLADLGMAPQRPPLGEVSYGDTARLGEVAYLPPERMTEAGPTAAGDLYGLGASLYFLLANRAPYAGASPVEVMLQLQQAEPAPIETLRADVPADVVALMRRCLSRDPLDRPAADEIAAALLPHGEPTARPQPAAGPAAVLSANETFTKPGIPSAAFPMVEPVHGEHGPQPEIHPLDDHHHDGHHDGEDHFTSSGPARARPKVKAKKSVSWIIAGLLLHGSGVLLLVGWMTNWFAFMRTPENPQEHKIEKKAETTKPVKKIRKSMD